MKIKPSDITCERSDFLEVFRDLGDLSTENSTDIPGIRKIRTAIKYFAKKYGLLIGKDFNPKLLLEKMKYSNDFADIGLAKKIEEILGYNTGLETHYLEALNASSMVLRVSREGKVLCANKNFLKVSGHNLEEIIGLETNQLSGGVSREEPKEFWENLWKTILSGNIWQGTIKNKSQDGKIYWTLTTIVPKIIDGEVDSFTVVRNNITDEKLLQENLDRLAQLSEEMLLDNAQLSIQSMTDPLTGLYNRRVLNDRLSEEISSALRSNTYINLVLFDVDHFKAINDTYGHPDGDKVLKLIAKRLNDITREEDVKFRYGGEEFALILSGKLTLEEIKNKIEEIRKSFEKMELNIGKGVKIKFTVSFGIAFFDNLSDFLSGVTEKSERTEMVIRQADNALYHAKESGRNCVKTNKD